MEKEVNVRTGTKGFYKKYPTLGKSVLMRVPESFKDTLYEILPLCDNALKTNKEEYNKVLSLFKEVLLKIKSSDDTH
jgi:hypothetical protein